MEGMERKRSHFTRERKKVILKELNLKGMTVSSLARREGVHPVTLYNWRKEMGKEEEKKSKDFSREILTENEDLKKENETLKKALGEAAVEKHILETANNILKKKYRLQ